MGATRDVVILPDGAASLAPAGNDGFIEFAQLCTRLAGRAGSGWQKQSKRKNRAA